MHTLGVLAGRTGSSSDAADRSRYGYAVVFASHHDRHKRIRETGTMPGNGRPAPGR